MFSYEKLKRIIKKNDTLHYYTKCIRRKSRDREFYELVLSDEKVFLPMESLGVKNFGRPVYNLELHLPHTGFSVFILETLAGLLFCDRIGAVPYVHIDSDNLYYEKYMDSVSDNVLEYYYKPISRIGKSEMYQSACVISSSWQQRNSIKEYTCERQSNYTLTDAYLTRLASTYKKYFSLKEDCRRKIESSLFHQCSLGKTLGVHIRGTDMHKQYNNHAVSVPVDEYIKETAAAIRTKGFKNIFLATDDEKILHAFKKEFGRDLRYYEDTLRSSDGGALHYETQSERPMHRYLLGLEVLRDIYTLAECSGFLSGLSSVPNIVTVVKGAKEDDFSYRKVLSNGIVDNMKIFDIGTIKKRNRRM